MQFRRRRRDAMLWLASYRSRLRPLSRRELTCISESPAPCIDEVATVLGPTCR